jgi:hypothetical protein
MDRRTGRRQQARRLDPPPACGLALDRTTIFWVGVLSLWVLAKGSAE